MNFAAELQNPKTRVDCKSIERQREYFSGGYLSRSLVDAIPYVVLVLNDRRQIVFCNTALEDLVEGVDIATVYGKRPGEVLTCTEAEIAPDGCGTGVACHSCGTALAIMTGEQGQAASRDCCITRKIDGGLQAQNYRASVKPLEFQGENFNVLSLQDISHEKRRRNLEQIFFHDILNVVGSISGMVEFLKDYDPVDRDQILERIQSSTVRIIEEIELHKSIAAAENHELKTQRNLIESRPLLEKAQHLFQHHELAEGRRFIIDEHCSNIIFLNDDVLIGRVLVNMIKNALEATVEGGVVTLGCREQGSAVEFSVHNPAVIPDAVQSQIFKRSYSTKGPGRGLGTYSMQLLSEFVDGSVSFVSAAGEGTTFYARYPQS